MVGKNYAGEPKLQIERDSYHKCKLKCILGLKQWNQGYKRSNAVFQQKLFPNMRDDEINVDTLTKMYHKYKTEYVKHLSFDPKEDQLSE